MYKDVREVKEGTGGTVLVYREVQEVEGGGEGYWVYNIGVDGAN